MARDKPLSVVNMANNTDFRLSSNYLRQDPRNMLTVIARRLENQKLKELYTRCEKFITCSHLAKLSR